MSLTASFRSFLVSWHSHVLGGCRFRGMWPATRPMKTFAPNHQQVKMTRMLQKMMNKGGKKKWTGFHGNMTEDVTGSGQSSFKKVTEGHRRRAEQVGKVLYDYIASLVNSGELHPSLVDHSVEVSKVKVVPDFSAVNVYWLASGTEADATTQKLLDNNAGKLRQMLISLHVIGNVPRVNFVQDMSQARISELEALLSVADMGPREDENTDLDKEMDSSQGQGVVGEPVAFSEYEINRSFRKLSHLANTSPSDFGSRTATTQDTESHNDVHFPQSSYKNWETEEEGVGSQDDNTQHLPTLRFRHDIYDINRDALADKVSILKKKNKIMRTQLPSNWSQSSVWPKSGMKYVKIEKKLSKVKKVTISDVQDVLENKERLSTFSTRVENELDTENVEEYGENWDCVDDKR